jgi:hypothetical protein
MSIEITPEPTLNALAAARGPQEIRAADGRLLGQFVPLGSQKMSFPEFGVPDEEIERELHDPDAAWVGPDEVIARLREIDRCTH